MKRLHVHIAVADLDDSIRFYAHLFGSAPSVRKPDYAKWELADPPLNLAVSARGRQPGIEHLGIEAGSDAELREVYARIRAAGGPVLEEGRTTCCYAESEKSWVTDPQGVRWEAFHTFGEAETFGKETDAGVRPPRRAEVCCGPPRAKGR